MLPSNRRLSLHQHQPKTFTLSASALSSFPYRICHPPNPEARQVHPWRVTPEYDVSLNDVLDRKHLPPLGLKDFEEWLLYVEQAPENLYFILWLREYTSRYRKWVLGPGGPSSTTSPSSSPSTSKPKSPTSRQVPKDHASSQLAMFYARAKQTFFTPNGDFELNVPSDVLAPFHVPNPSAKPHPDPALFEHVANEAQVMLRQSLQRFVLASYTNVGTNRAVCGTVGGTCIALILGVPPLVVSFALHASRFYRLVSLPGLWLGLTIVLASLHGVCMMIYVFGDLRQLRKFELARPSISKPQPLSAAIGRVNVKEDTPRVCAPQPITRPPALTFGNIQPPPQAHLSEKVVSRPLSVISSTSRYSSHGSDPSSSESGDDIVPSIQISPAYYDEVPSVGMSPAGFYDSPVPRPGYTFPYFPGPTNSPIPVTFSATAGFIHPYDPLCDDDRDLLPEQRPAPEDRQYMAPFDFDDLPHPSEFGPSFSPPAACDGESRRRAPSAAAAAFVPAYGHGYASSYRYAYTHAQRHLYAHKIPGAHQNQRHTFACSAPSIPPACKGGNGWRTWANPRAVLGRMQYGCNERRWRVQTGLGSRNEAEGGEEDVEKGVRVVVTSSTSISSPVETPPSEKDDRKRKTRSARSSLSSSSPPGPGDRGECVAVRSTPFEVRVERRVSLVRSVPAFRSPLTRVLSPVVVRAQWEIVVRSAAVAFVLVASVLGGLIVVPESV